MIDFLNTEEKNETIEQLMSDFEKDPMEVCTALEEKFARECVTGAIELELLSEQGRVSEFAGHLIERLTTLEHKIPVRRSIFRNREESEQMYRAIVPFLSSMNIPIRQFRSAVLALSLLRDRAVQAYLRLVRTEWLCRELLKRQEKDNYRDRVAKLLEEVMIETARSETLRKSLQDRFRTWQSFDTDVILRFLQNAETALDAEHDGAGCDCTRVVALLGELKRETGKLL